MMQPVMGQPVVPGAIVGSEVVAPPVAGVAGVTSVAAVPQPYMSSGELLINFIGIMAIFGLCVYLIVRFVRWITHDCSRHW
jgi:hypothetical protein